MTLPLTGAGPSVGGSIFDYANKVAAIEAGDLIAYWPMWEAAGAVADNYEGTAVRDGAYTGVTLGQPGIGDGNTCPFFDGANDMLDVYTTSFRDAFSGAAGTVAIWVQASVAEWGDGTDRRIFNFYVDGNNRVYMQRVEPNEVVITYEAGNVIETAIVTGFTTASFYHLAVTWDKAAEEVKLYKNGLQFGATMGTLGVWAGVLIITNTVIGAYNNTPGSIWNGKLAHCPVWTKALSPAQILSLATV